MDLLITNQGEPCGRPRLRLICATFSSQDIKGCLEASSAASSRVIHGLTGCEAAAGLVAGFRD